MRYLTTTWLILMAIIAVVIGVGFVFQIWTPILGRLAIVEVILFFSGFVIAPSTAD